MKSAMLKIMLLVAVMALAIPALALHGSDIILTDWFSATRLHTLKWADRAGGAQSYDVKGAEGGTGMVVFYRRAVNAGGYPRGVVIEQWSYYFDESPFNSGMAADADSVAVIWSTTGKLVIRPVKK